MIELYNDDCMNVLQKMIDEGKRVDAIITSPPYNMNLRIMHGKYVSRCRNKNHKIEFSNKYDVYTDDMPMNDYFNFQDEFVSKALQVTDLMFYNIQMVTGNKIALFQLLGKYADKIKEVIIWNKTTAQPAMQIGTLNSQYEFVFVFQNSKPYNRSFDSALFKRGTESNVWDIKRERNTLIKAGFPKELVKRIIIDFLPPNAIIMDPFMGSGTAGVVCKEFNRDFIGVESDKDMFNKAKERINEI